MHGGTVTAESQGPGTGSTLTITLPVLPFATPSVDAPPPSPPLAVPSRRILVVDDNQ